MKKQFQLSGRIFICLVFVLGIPATLKAQTSARAKTTLDAAHDAAFAVDGDPATYYSSDAKTDPLFIQDLFVDFGEVINLGKVSMMPRYVGGVATCFPADFKIHYSIDGVTYLPASGQSKVGYQLSGDENTPEMFKFKETYEARYIRIRTFKTTADTDGNFYLQLAEVKMHEGEPVVTPDVYASSELSADWAITKIVDRNDNQVWSSVSYATENATEWFYLDLKSKRDVKTISLSPRYNVDIPLAFPKDFKLQYSDNGSDWIDLPNQSYTDYVIRGNNQEGEAFVLDNVVSTRYIRVLATKLSADDSGMTYFFQLAEARVFGPVLMAGSNSMLDNNHSAEMAVDGDRKTYWSSTAAPAETSAPKRDLIIDFGEVAPVGGVAYMPRYEAGVATCFPKTFKIQYSADSVAWIPTPDMYFVDYQLQGDEHTPEVFEFKESVDARYIRLRPLVESMDADGNYYVQIAEVNAWTGEPFVPATVTTSSVVAPGWEGSNLNDRHDGTVWSSDGHASGDAVEWFVMDFGVVREMQKVELSPRYAGDLALCFPKNFKFQVSDDGTTWTDVPGQTYTDYVMQGDKTKSEVFIFSQLLHARYLKVEASVLTTDDSGTAYLFQLKEARVYGKVIMDPSATSSSDLDEAHTAAMAIDGDNATYWSSTASASADHTEWFYIDYLETSWISKIYLSPRYVNGSAFCFPVDFSIQYSTDGTTWEAVPGQAYTNYTLTGTEASPVEEFVFGLPVQAQFIRIEATKLTADDYNNFYFQLAEISVETVMGAIYYADSDGDTYGDVQNPMFADSKPVGYVEDNTDCNDAEVTVYPGASEICGDGLDNNCDGTVDEDCPSGVEQNSLTSGLVAYPNPASDVLYFNSNKAVDVTVFSVDGRMMLRKSNVNELDISPLKNGMYMLEVSQEEVKVKQVLIVSK